MILSDEFSRRYFEYLVYENIVAKPSWIPILEILHSRDYYSMMIMDNSREGDGKLLRDNFMAKINGQDAITFNSSPWADVPCSMLEMMIALSNRLVYEFYSVDDDIYPMSTIIFASMMDSLGINVEMDSQEDIENIITRFIRREYSPDGEGSLFDLRGKTVDIDWRDLPIWNQAMAWVTLKPIELLGEE